MADAPVAPEVFDFIDTFSDQSSIWSVASTTPLDPQANVLAFCENFFVQFFEAEMETEITSFSSVSAQRAGLLRRRSSTTPAQRKLIRDFQHVCKSHADLVGESYGSGSDERAEFFFAVMPNLLVAATGVGRRDKFVPSLDSHVKG
jgi:hypothetical protein